MLNKPEAFIHVKKHGLIRIGKWIFFLSACLAGMALFIGGLTNYPGSKLVYLFFSVIFWLMLLTAFGRRTHYGYIYLVIALWLGFWLKITAHLLFSYPYVEPIGRFDGSPTAWDSVLVVALFASAGVMLGKLLFTLTIKKYTRTVKPIQTKVPVWYPAVRKRVWALSLVAIIGIAAINLILGIQQIGLVPRTILPWPLNALISWLVSIGSALMLTVLLWWELLLGKSIAVSVYALLMEATISTVTLLSRGVYIFHMIPQLFSLFENRQWVVGLSKTKIIAFILIVISLVVVSISMVTSYRAYMYPDVARFTTENQQRLIRLEVIEGGIAHLKILIANGELQEGALRELLAEKAQLENGIPKKEIASNVPVETDKTLKDKEMANLASNSGGLLRSPVQQPTELKFHLDAGDLSRILSLAIDRWIGLEGVMAVSAYQEKNFTQLVDALREKREIGKVTKYQDICNSHYRWVDTANWQFASLPGAAAFLYFSGSMWMVMLGMMTFALLLQLSEQLVFTLTYNPLLCSLFGLTLANSIAQFGITPRQDVPFYSMILGFVLLVHVLQSDKVSTIIRNYWANRCDRGAV